MGASQRRVAAAKRALAVRGPNGQRVVQHAQRSIALAARIDGLPEGHRVQKKRQQSPPRQPACRPLPAVAAVHVQARARHAREMAASQQAEQSVRRDLLMARAERDATAHQLSSAARALQQEQGASRKALAQLSASKKQLVTNAKQAANSAQAAERKALRQLCATNAELNATCSALQATESALAYERKAHTTTTKTLEKAHDELRTQRAMTAAATAAACASDKARAAAAAELQHSTAQLQAAQAALAGEHARCQVR